jgi:enamine deaminase RidA (YjgF/YER057c/UK114 family)
MSTHQFMNPPGLMDGAPFGYSQVGVAAPGRIVALAGQAAIHADGTVLGGGFEGQLRLALENVRDALAAAGCTPAHVIQARIYVVGLTPAMLDPVKAVLRDTFGDQGPPNSLIGVAALAFPELLVEVEVLAVRPD